MARWVVVDETATPGLLARIDEVHAAGRENLRDLAATFQHLVRERRQIALISAGPPSAVSDLPDDDVLTSLRRALRVVLEDVPLGLVRDALRATIEAGGRSIDDDALAAAAEATGRGLSVHGPARRPPGVAGGDDRRQGSEQQRCRIVR